MALLYPKGLRIREEAYRLAKKLLRLEDGSTKIRRKDRTKVVRYIRNTIGIATLVSPLYPIYYTALYKTRRSRGNYISRLRRRYEYYNGRIRYEDGV